MEPRKILGIPSWRTVFLAAICAAAFPLLSALASLDAEVLKDPAPWFVSIGVGALRGFAGSLLYALWGPR